MSRMNRIGAAVLAVLTTLGAAGAASAFDGRKPEDLAGLLRANGFEVKINATLEKRVILVAAKEKDQRYFNVDMTGCDAARTLCTVMSYTAAWDYTGRVSMDHANSWNQHRAICYAFLDYEDKAPTVNYTLSTLGPKTRESSQMDFDDFMVCMTAFDNFVADPVAYLKDLDESF